MWKEIERKFLIKKMPILDDLVSVDYERYFIYNHGGVEIRVQKKWDIYEFERKQTENKISAKKLKYQITKDEFEQLKKQAAYWIFRKSYKVSEEPKITIKIYSGRFEWLSRAEVEFVSEENANSFTLPDWFGDEITDSSLGRDSRLVKLSEEEFKKLMKS